MTDAVPWLARRVLHQGVLCHLAARTPSGPHLTPVVYVFDGGRVWLTTSRRSVKARAWKQDRTVAGMVRAGELAVSFRGRVRTYDAFDPLSWPAATVGGPWLIRAATRFTFKNARFFAGYAADAGRVPLAWSPPGRVFARVGPELGWVVKEGAIVERWGADEPRGARFRRSFQELPRGRGLDLGVPARIRRVIGASGTGAVGFQPEVGEPTVLPVRWRRVGAEGAFDAVAARALIDLTGAGPDVPAALTLDHASTWRASDMSGMLIRGTAALYATGETRRGVAAMQERIRLLGTPEDALDDAVLVRIRPSRVVWWQGWTSGTVASR